MENAVAYFANLGEIAWLFVPGNITSLPVGLTHSRPIFPLLSDKVFSYGYCTLRVLLGLCSDWPFQVWAYLTSIASSSGKSSSNSFYLPQIMFRKGFLPRFPKELITWPGQLVMCCTMTFQSTRVHIDSGGQIRL